MKNIIGFFLRIFFKIIIWFRYKVKVEGLEHINKKNLKKTGGILFLPNHPAVFIDPVVVTLAITKKFDLRPLVVEYMFYTPGVHVLSKLLGGLPVPNYDESSNSLKRRQGEKVMQELIGAIKKGDNFLVYPAGRIKHTAIEKIGGASGAKTIIDAAPEANVVLVRVKGLWGSRFSRALTGQTPPMFANLWEGIKICLKNLLFFTPRRKVIIEFVPAPADFPYKGTRSELNRYLENWYNQPDGLTEQEGEYPGDSLVLVSNSVWKTDLPKVFTPKQEVGLDDGVNLKEVPQEIKDKLLAKFAALSDLTADKIEPQMTLANDIGLDSLDVADLVVFLKDEFDVSGFSILDLTTVSRVFGIASKQIVFEKQPVKEDWSNTEWKKPVSRFKVQIAHGETIPEAFLNNCERMGHTLACVDPRSGVLPYSKLKLRVLILAEYIRHLPGKYVGIMLPSSVASFATIFACQLAGKVPLMVNWTIGPRHLQSVIKQSKVEVILSSWAFLDRLDSVDLSGAEDLLLPLEDVARSFSLKDKLRAVYRSKMGTKKILQAFGTDKLTSKDEAVLLFTSGTESLPKGVPLTHHNILSNQRASLDVIDLYSDDVIYNFLPPFHSFGFTLSGMIGLLAGIKTVYTPDPTDGVELARTMDKWNVTVICGAPTFIKGLAKAAKPQQVKSLRICFTGAERTPPQLIDAMTNLGKGQCLLEGYGITECSPVLTANRTGQPARGVGKPIPGVEIAIIHPESNEKLPQGSEGMIVAKGPNIFSGYINPGLASPFVELEGASWYKTGDLGYLDKEGNLIISGRLKRFIKIGGEMISLPAVEESLLHLAKKKGLSVNEEGPSLAVCAEEKGGEKPDIYLFTRFELPLDEANQALRAAGFSNLVKITHVKKLLEIPVMGTGKINYRLLEERYIVKKGENKSA